MSKVGDTLQGLRDRLNLAEDYADTFSSPQGQRVLRHIMKVSHVVSPTFVQGDPHATSFREGQRHLAISILRMVNRDTTALIKQIEGGLQNE